MGLLCDGLIYCIWDHFASFQTTPFEMVQGLLQKRRSFHSRHLRIIVALCHCKQIWHVVCKKMLLRYMHSCNVLQIVISSHHGWPTLVLENVFKGTHQLKNHPPHDHYIHENKHPIGGTFYVLVIH